jgi:hypothetical protein
VLRRGKLHDLLGPVTVDDLPTHHAAGIRQVFDGRRP